MTTLPFDLARAQADLSGKGPRQVLRAALEAFDRIAISFSGAEDVILVDMAASLRPDVQVFSLDTGRLHPETYRLMDAVRKRYDLEIELLSPDPQQLEPFVRQKGLFSFYADGHSECCGIRKVAPLRRKLSGLDAWVTGQRRDQSLTRIELAEVEQDLALSASGQTLIKFNPLAGWTSAQVWDYIEAHDVPFNALHRQGFVSIGCEPCTRAILPNQHEREGRWWWEEAAKKECGLHAGNQSG